MIHISNTIVFGFEPALHGMRDPKESWDRSDSDFFYTPPNADAPSWGGYDVPETPILGPNDLDLMRRLIIAGPEHRKFLRAIDIWAFIEPDRGCWQEIDTYKIGTVRNSCSTMHKLGTRPLTEDDFYEGIVLPETLTRLNELGAMYRDTNDFKLVERMKRIIPEGYIQGADYKMSYENALNMFGQRRNHRLPEWRWTGGCNPSKDGRVSLCDWIWSLPYFKEIIGWIEKSEEDKKEALHTEGRNKERETTVMAARNIGYDLTCGRCAEVFYCGVTTAHKHDPGCTTSVCDPVTAEALREEGRQQVRAERTEQLRRDSLLIADAPSGAV